MDKKRMQKILKAPGNLITGLRVQFRYARMKPLAKNEAFVAAVLKSDTDVMTRVFSSVHDHAHQQVMMAMAIHDVVTKGTLEALQNLFLFEKSDRGIRQAFDNAVDLERTDIVTWLLDAKNGFGIGADRVSSALERLVSYEAFGYAEKKEGGREALVRLLTSHGGDFARTLEAADLEVTKVSDSAKIRAERLKAFRARL